MRLPRMTTRRWMVVVAVLAPILLAARLLSLSAIYRAMANRYDVEFIGATPILHGRVSVIGSYVHQPASLRAQRAG